MRYLFIEGSIKGGVMEKKALRLFRNCDLLKEFNMTVELGSEDHDFQYAVDIVIYDSNNNEVLGIQVKPDTYKRYKDSSRIVKQNKAKNDLYNKPVKYVYYDKDNKFVKQIEFEKELREILINHTNKK